MRVKQCNSHSDLQDRTVVRWEDEMTVDVALDFRKKTSDESRSIRAINVSHAEMNDRRHSASRFHELLRIIIKTTS